MGYKVDAKVTTNSLFSLDIRHVKKYGFLKDEHVTSGEINQRFTSSNRRLKTSIVSYYGEYLKLTYERNGKEVSCQLPITYSDCNYGGERPWFCCPNTNCNKRVGKLFLLGDYFLCRHCHNLAYETQNMPEPFRQLEKAQNIRERLGAKSLATIDPFPPKPKWMHHRTYMKLWKEYYDLIDVSWGLSARRWNMAI